MTIKAIRENLEDAIANGLPWYKNGKYSRRYPSLHEARLYSICEGLIVEVERLQERVEKLESQLATHQHHNLAVIGPGPNVEPSMMPTNALEEMIERTNDG